MNDSLLNLSGNVQHKELEVIHDRYMNCLRTFTEYNYPQEPNRVEELLVKLPEVLIIYNSYNFLAEVEIIIPCAKSISYLGF